MRMFCVAVSESKRLCRWKMKPMEPANADQFCFTHAAQLAVAAEVRIPDFDFAFLKCA